MECNQVMKMTTNKIWENLKKRRKNIRTYELKKLLTLFLPIKTKVDFLDVVTPKTYSKTPTTIKVKVTINMRIYVKKEHINEIVKACPHCPSKLPQDKIQKFLNGLQHCSALFNHIKIVEHLNTLTKRAEQEKISYTKYAKEWNKIVEIIERGDYVIYARYLPEMYAKPQANSVEHPHIHEEKCKKCKRITHFDLIVEPDVKLLPCLPKYKRRRKDAKPKQKCPKCNKLGIPHKDKRGYTRFYHYKDNKRKVCYIGKIAQ